MMGRQIRAAAAVIVLMRTSRALSSVLFLAAAMAACTRPGRGPAEARPNGNRTEKPPSILVICFGASAPCALYLAFLVTLFNSLLSGNGHYKSLRGRL